MVKWPCSRRPQAPKLWPSFLRGTAFFMGRKTKDRARRVRIDKSLDKFLRERDALGRRAALNNWVGEAEKQLMKTRKNRRSVLPENYQEAVSREVAELSGLADLFYKIHGPTQSADGPSLVFRRLRAGFTTEQLKQAKYDVDGLASRGLLQWSKSRKVWTPHGALYERLFGSPAQVDGFLQPIPPREPAGVFPNNSGYRLGAFRNFMSSLRVWANAAVAAREGATEGNAARISKSARAQENFLKRYHKTFESLCHLVPVDSPRGRAVFINASCFPRSAEGKKLFWQFVDCVDDIFDTKKGQSAGGPSETRGLSREEQEIVEKTRKKYKNPKQRSARYLAEEIHEQTKKGDVLGSKKRANLEQNVKRHFHRIKPRR